jgi:hypothetical protein
LPDQAVKNIPAFYPAATDRRLKRTFMRRSSSPVPRCFRLGSWRRKENFLVNGK